jgi:hypothetical protein
MCILAYTGHPNKVSHMGPSQIQQMLSCLHFLRFALDALNSYLSDLQQSTAVNSIIHIQRGVVWEEELRSMAPESFAYAGAGSIENSRTF